MQFSEEERGVKEQKQKEQQGIKRNFEGEQEKIKSQKVTVYRKKRKLTQGKNT